MGLTDTGIRIKPDDLARLFQGFVQLATTQAQKQEGTGLGLALTQRLVELQGASSGPPPMGKIAGAR